MGGLSATGERWADILDKLQEHTQEALLAYHNAGLSASVISPTSPGYEASVKPSASERLQDDVIAQSPDLLVIAYGLNDVLAGMDVQDFEREMSALVDQVRQSLSPLIVIANVYHMPTHSIIRRSIGEESRLPAYTKRGCATFFCVCLQKPASKKMGANDDRSRSNL